MNSINAYVIAARVRRERSLDGDLVIALMPCLAWSSGNSLILVRSLGLTEEIVTHYHRKANDAAAFSAKSAYSVFRLAEFSGARLLNERPGLTGLPGLKVEP